MSGSWVAGTTRAKALACRRLGVRGARELAVQPSLESALQSLSASPYGHAVTPGQSLEAAQQAVAETLLWNLRVLAGWLPGSGAELLRALAGWFEIANVDEQLAGLDDWGGGKYFVLGGLSTAWPRMAEAGDLPALRQVLATSRWGDPAGGTARDVRLRMLAAWAQTVYTKVPAARVWVTRGVAIFMARLVFLDQQDLPESTVTQFGSVLPGLAGMVSDDLAGFVAALPTHTRSLLEAPPSISGPDDQMAIPDRLAETLWRAEGRWWTVLEQDAFGLLRTSGFGPEPTVGAAGLLAADAWRVRSALGAAASGTPGLETFDALV